MTRDFQQTVWDEQLQDQWRQILELALREDVENGRDWTTEALVSEDAEGTAAVVAREAGILAGLAAVECTLDTVEPRLRWSADLEDGHPVEAHQRVGRIDGPTRGILAAERLVLNLLGRLSGIATLTRKYVDAIGGTGARVYDTRKTTPGWRRLEKYAVRCGGGYNHRTGLFDAVLIKDNHLAVRAAAIGEKVDLAAAEAIARVRKFLAQRNEADLIVEVEVDTLEQLDAVLAAGPDIVLLDNMSPATLREAVARRDATNPRVELEASGGVDLGSVKAIAQSGVERISVGALTHSAVCLDLGLDWRGSGR